MNIDSKEFLNHCNVKNIVAVWQDLLPNYEQRVATEGLPLKGAIGWQGPSGPNDPNSRDNKIKNKFGINTDPDFKLPEFGIGFNITVNNEAGYDYIRKLLKDLYDVNAKIKTNKIKGELKDEKKLQEIKDSNKKIEIRNEQAKIRYDKFITQLYDIADVYDIEASPKREDLLSTDECYEWTEIDVYPHTFWFEDRDVDRIKQLWFDTKIMHEC